MKTGYHVLEEIERKQAVSGSDQATQRSFWKGIWKLNIPKKIRIFFWRACTDSLPTMKILHHRKVVASPLCTTYGKSEETTLHALWECEKIQISWGSDFNGLHNLHHRPCSIMNLICKVRHEGKSVEQFWILAWFVWCRRNKSQFKEPCLSPNKLFETASNSLAEFQMKKVESSPNLNLGQVRVQAGFLPKPGPALGFFNPNLTLFFIGLGRVAAGWVEMAIHTPPMEYGVSCRYLEFVATQEYIALVSNNFFLCNWVIRIHKGVWVSGFSRAIGIASY